MYVSKRIDSWLDKDYLISISDEIINLEDYVPKLIELHLPDYNKRKEKVSTMKSLMCSETFQLNQVIDQMAAGQLGKSMSHYTTSFLKNIRNS